MFAGYDILDSKIIEDFCKLICRIQHTQILTVQCRIQLPTRLHRLCYPTKLLQEAGSKFRGSRFSKAAREVLKRKNGSPVLAGYCLVLDEAFFFALRIRK